MRRKTIRFHPQFVVVFALLLAACSTPQSADKPLPPPGVVQLPAPGVAVRGPTATVGPVQFSEQAAPTLAPLQPDALSLTLAAPLTPTPLPPALPTADPGDYDSAPPRPELAALGAQLFGADLPARLIVPAIGLESGITPVGWQLTAGGVQWDSPREQAGFLISSAAPGTSGNTVIYGHNNIYGALFRWLDQVRAGDVVQIVTAGGSTVDYTVAQVEVFAERDLTPAARAANLAYFNPTNDARLTLLSCWPYTDNSHRVAVVARLSG